MQTDPCWCICGKSDDLLFVNIVIIQVLATSTAKLSLLPDWLIKGETPGNRRKIAAFLKEMLRDSGYLNPLGGGEGRQVTGGPTRAGLGAAMSSGGKPGGCSLGRNRRLHPNICSFRSDFLGSGSGERKYLEFAATVRLCCCAASAHKDGLCRQNHEAWASSRARSRAWSRLAAGPGVRLIWAVFKPLEMFPNLCQPLIRPRTDSCFNGA